MASQTQTLAGGPAGSFHHEYNYPDAYGKLLSQTGTAPSNYGFSTKPMDQLTGLLHYGYRYLDPVTGRWINRDPIEEAGGVNLYGFVGNDGVGRWDLLGRFPKGLPTEFPDISKDRPFEDIELAPRPIERLPGMNIRPEPRPNPEDRRPREVIPQAFARACGSFSESRNSRR